MSHQKEVKALLEQLQELLEKYSDEVELVASLARSLNVVIDQHSGGGLRSALVDRFSDNRDIHNSDDNDYDGDDDGSQSSVTALTSDKTMSEKANLTCNQLNRSPKYRSAFQQSHSLLNSNDLPRRNTSREHAIPLDVVRGQDAALRSLGDFDSADDTAQSTSCLDESGAARSMSSTDGGGNTTDDECDDMRIRSDDDDDDDDDDDSGSDALGSSDDTPFGQQRYRHRQSNSQWSSQSPQRRRRCGRFASTVELDDVSRLGRRHWRSDKFGKEGRANDDTNLFSTATLRLDDDDDSLEDAQRRNSKKPARRRRSDGDQSTDDTLLLGKAAKSPPLRRVRSDGSDQQGELRTLVSKARRRRQGRSEARDGATSPPPRSATASPPPRSAAAGLAASVAAATGDLSPNNSGKCSAPSEKRKTSNSTDVSPNTSTALPTSNSGGRRRRRHNSTPLSKQSRSPGEAKPTTDDIVAAVVAAADPEPQPKPVLARRRSTELIVAKRRAGNFNALRRASVGDASTSTERSLHSNPFLAPAQTTPLKSMSQLPLNRLATAAADDGTNSPAAWEAPSKPRLRRNSFGAAMRRRFQSAALPLHDSNARALDSLLDPETPRAKAPVGSLAEHRAMMLLTAAQTPKASNASSPDSGLRFASMPDRRRSQRSSTSLTSLLARTVRRTSTGSLNAASASSAAVDATGLRTTIVTLADSIAICADAIELNELIGYGGSARVNRGSLFGLSLAVKSVSVDEAEIDALFAEVALVRSLAHENIVRCFGALRNDDVVTIFYELYSGTLRNVLDDCKQAFAMPMSFKETLSVLGDIASAMQFIHSQSPPIAHRDIKAENCFVQRSANPVQRRTQSQSSGVDAFTQRKQKRAAALQMVNEAEERLRHAERERNEARAQLVAAVEAVALQSAAALSRASSAKPPRLPRASSDRAMLSSSRSSAATPLTMAHSADSIAKPGALSSSNELEVLTLYVKELRQAASEANQLYVRADDWYRSRKQLADQFDMFDANPDCTATSSPSKSAPRLVRHVVLGDFGEAAAITGLPLAFNIGTPEFMAPEVFSPKTGRGIYNESCDVWSFGMTIFEVITCDIPFRAEGVSAFDIGDHIKAGHPPQIPIGRVGPEHKQLLDLMKKCTHLQPHKRPSAKAVCKELGKLLKHSS